MEPQVVSDVQILGGKPHVRGTRLSVAFILELLASGATREDILTRWPQLTPEGLEAALRYAADSLKDDIVWTTRLSA